MVFTGRICAIDHAGLHVRDLQRSLWFYGEVLGLPLLPRPELGFPGAWLRIGAQELHLIAKEPLTRIAGSMSSVSPGASMQGFMQGIA